MTVRPGDDAAARPTVTQVGRPITVLRSLGPGLVTGAADDHPSGIATYRHVGFTLA